jgi:protein-tyrosine phosphatase
MSSYRLTWRPLRGGHLAIGHKPGRALRDALAQGGCTRRLSLLGDHESDAEESDALLRLPLPSADPPGAHRSAEVRACFERLLALLERGEKIYIHCSAGLHRTGMVTHAFLRWLGHSREEALALMRELREATADAATEPRLAWGDQFAAR